MCEMCNRASAEVIDEIAYDVDQYDPYYDDPMDPTDAEDRW